MISFFKCAKIMHIGEHSSTAYHSKQNQGEWGFQNLSFSYDLRFDEKFVLEGFFFFPLLPAWSSVLCQSLVLIHFLIPFIFAQLCITEATEICFHDIQTEAVIDFSLCAERLEAENVMLKGSKWSGWAREGGQLTYGHQTSGVPWKSRR